MDMIGKVDKVGVHATHCCILHGCKYGDDTCPVESGLVVQEYTCEYCDDVGIRTVDDVLKVVNGEVEQCPHCGYVLKK